MAIQVGINGFGRIGRVIFRILAERSEEFNLCGINLRNADIPHMVYMAKYDSIFGRFHGTLEAAEDGILVNGKRFRYTVRPIPPRFPGRRAEQSTSLNRPVRSTRWKNPTPTW